MLIHTFQCTSYTSHTVLPWTLESWAEYDIRIFVEDRKARDFVNTEHALVVLNHRGDLDWMIGWVLIDRLGMLGVSGLWIVL